MEAEKKVIFLFIALIILIISCVYFNTQKIYDKQMLKVVPNDTIVKEPIKVSVPEETIETQAKQEAQLTVESIQEDLNNSKEKIVSKELEEKPQIEEPQALEKEESKKEEPLIIIDKDKYIRVDSEKYIQELSIQTQELQIQINKIVSTTPIIFKRASTKLLKKSEKTIDTIARLLKKYNNIRIEIAGHTDAAGADDLNKRVSIERADRIKELISSYGISKDRLVARGYGEDIPLVENNENGYSLINRRVEFNIIEE